jgi:AcrR family transcriptional regulator
MAGPTQSRRERHREDSARQIRTIALRHMAQNGTAAVSLRAIAREMGMSAGAVYGYYETRDALITALIAEVYDSLADTLERAVAEAGPAPAAQVTAYGRAYRGWALAHPQKFRLVYGDPVPDYRIPAAGPAAEAEHRACTVLTSVVAAAWPWAREWVGDGPSPRCRRTRWRSRCASGPGCTGWSASSCTATCAR